MRIGLVCPYSVSVPGGVQGQVLGLAAELRRLDHHVDVLAPCDGDAPPGVVAVGRSLPIPVNGSTAAMAPTPLATARTIGVLASRRYDVVHLHEPLAPSITVPALLAPRAAVVATFHAGGDRTPYRWAAPVVRRLARRIDVRVAVSAEAARVAARHLGGAYTVLANGIDPTRFTGAARHRAPRTVLFVGRVEPRKGLAVAVDAMASLPDDVELWIAGDGPERARLQGRCATDTRIRWLGRVDDAVKLDLLRSAAVVCVPSLHGESFGVVLLEAMAAGTAVVASDIPAYRALTGTAGPVSLVPPGDPAALAAALARVLDDPWSAARSQAEGPAVVRQHTMGEVARRYVELYDRAASQRVSGRRGRRPWPASPRAWRRDRSARSGGRRDHRARPRSRTAPGSAAS